MNLTLSSMFSHASALERVDVDFSRARRRALLRRVRTGLRRDASSDGLLCFEGFAEVPGASARVYRGRRTVPVAQIGATWEAVLSSIATLCQPGRARERDGCA